jgi:hypothetical protein
MDRAPYALHGQHASQHCQESYGPHASYRISLSLSLSLLSLSLSPLSLLSLSLSTLSSLSLHSLVSSLALSRERESLPLLSPSPLSLSSCSLLGTPRMVLLRLAPRVVRPVRLVIASTLVSASLPNGPRTPRRPSGPRNGTYGPQRRQPRMARLCGQRGPREARLGAGQWHPGNPPARPAGSAGCRRRRSTRHSRARTHAGLVSSPERETGASALGFQRAQDHGSSITAT